MKCLAAIMAYTVISVSSIAVYAQTPPTRLTGIELYNWCRASDVEGQTICMDYLAGFFEGITIGQQLAGRGYLLCIPAGITAPQAKLIFEKTAKDHPELLNQPATVIAGRALFDAYRCKPGQTPIYGATPN